MADCDVIEKTVGGVSENIEMTEKPPLNRIDSKTSFTSVSDLNRAFDRQNSTLDKNSAIVNGTLTYVASTDNLIEAEQQNDVSRSPNAADIDKQAPAKVAHLNDVTVNEFFMASAAQSSPLISGRLFTTSL